MIYVYISPDFATYENKDNYTFRTILKIGYSKDETLTSRDNAYKTENPGRRLLYTIPDGSLQDETNLHKKFKHLLVCGNEWFENSEEIHEFFKTHTTKESIRYLSNTVNIKEGSKCVGNLYKNYKYTLHRFFMAFKNILGFQDNSVVQYILETDKEFLDVEGCLLDWVCKVYPDIASSVIYEFEYFSKLENLYSDFIEYLRDYNSGSVSYRLKVLCDSPDFSDEDKRLVAQQVSEKFDKYYNLIGPDRCRALGYNVTRINQEIENMKINPNDIRSAFLDNFKVGDNISKVEIKKLVGSLYQNLGLEKKAKATDLGEYFEIKNSKIKDKTGTWVNSLEILSRKPWDIEKNA